MEWRSEFDALPGVCRCLSRRSAHLITRLPRRDAFMNQRRRPMLRGLRQLSFRLLVVLALPTGTRRRCDGPMAATQSETGMHTPWRIGESANAQVRRTAPRLRRPMAMVSRGVRRSIDLAVSPPARLPRHFAPRRARRWQLAHDVLVGWDGIQFGAAAGRDRPLGAYAGSWRTCRWSRQGGRDRSRGGAQRDPHRRDGDGRYVHSHSPRAPTPGCGDPPAG